MWMRSIEKCFKIIIYRFVDVTQIYIFKQFGCWQTIGGPPADCLEVGQEQAVLEAL